MTDREKQIEEMAKDIRIVNELQASDKFTPNYFEAICLVNLGYRKIPEDSVVLSREEYESLIEQARKETARVILKELIKNCQYTFNSVGKPIIALSGDFALNVSKRYGVDIEE